MKRLFDTPTLEVRELAPETGVMSGAMLISAESKTGVYLVSDDVSDVLTGYTYWKGFGE